MRFNIGLTYFLSFAVYSTHSWEEGCCRHGQNWQWQNRLLLDSSVWEVTFLNFISCLHVWNLSFFFYLKIAGKINQRDKGTHHVTNKRVGPPDFEVYQGTREIYRDEGRHNPGWWFHGSSICSHAWNSRHHYCHTWTFCPLVRRDGAEVESKQSDGILHWLLLIILLIRKLNTSFLMKRIDSSKWDLASSFLKSSTACRNRDKRYSFPQLSPSCWSTSPRPACRIPF